MTPYKTAITAAGVTLLALGLARCGSTVEPTAWIPRDGSVSGVITVSSASLTAPRPSLAGAGDSPRAMPFGFPAPSRFTFGAARRSTRARSAALIRAVRGGSTSSELIVTFRHTALGAPPLGSAALRGAGAAGVFGRAIRARLAALVPAGATVAGVSPTILAAKIRVADATQRDAIAAALRHEPGIAGVVPNQLIWLDETPFYGRVTSRAGATGPTTPNNPLYPFQSWHYGLVDLPRAWAITTGSAGVLVAVVDDGIRFDHPAIRGNLTSDGYDFVNSADSLPLCAGGTTSNADDGDGYDADPTIPASYSLDSTRTCFLPDTLGNHGLHVAGTIGAVGNNGIGVAGVNWAVRIRPVRVLGVGGFGSAYDVAQGVLYAAGLPADNGAGGTVQPPVGARIINLSLGSPQSDTTLQRAILSATQAGALVVAAAGNAGTSAPDYPAAYPGVLAVAAVGPDGEPAQYSNYGSYVGIRAPGGNFAFGDATDGVMSTIWNFATGSPEYAWAEGTSMATPHVSGVAALVLSQAASLTASDLRSRLTTYATGNATAYGAGLLNAYNSVTARHGPPTQLYARLYTATTGAIAQTILAQADGSFRFSAVEDGSYLVYGGADESNDATIGIPGRVWGAFGGVASPGAVTVLGAVPNAMSFTVGFPSGSLSNHAIAAANPLVIGGYMQGRIVDSATADYYKVRIPAAATYTFETSGWVGACGVALEEATAIGLFDGAGTFLTFTSYIAPARFDYCSRLTLNLNQGTYYIGVAGVFGHRYRIQARAGG